MNKQQVIQHFTEHHGMPAFEQQIVELEHYFLQNKAGLVDGLIASFRQMCGHLHLLQQNGRKGPIAFIHYSMLRTSVLDQSFTYKMEGYSEKWYGDPSPFFHAYDTSWLYQDIPIIRQVLDRARKTYMNQIRAGEVERMVLRQLEVLHPFVVAIARIAMPLAIQLPEYKALIKAPVLRVRVGEYMDFSEDVYVEHQEPRDERDIRNRLEQDQGQGHRQGQGQGGIQPYDSLRGLDLKGVKCKAADLRYVDFSDSELTDSGFQSCALIGSRWQACSAAGADFRHSLLTDADFRHADLRGALFEHCSGQPFKEGLHRFPGLLGVQFDGANLAGASFVGARLGRSSFEGANLEQAVFSAIDQQLFPLSEQQRQVIQWV
ncbi:hypothetical protein ASF12_29275 [Paenibacillus sp. Leaf72]|nr:hypothetical protein ASF12_29275 [Paenibacillus sp. Leaf72]